jgi:uncharacterized delta-60 repeat protein
VRRLSAKAAVVAIGLVGVAGVAGPAGGIVPQERSYATFDLGEGSKNAVYEVAPHGDGYVVAGSAQIGGDNDFVVARLGPDGTVDRSFGDGGSFTLDGMGGYDWAESVAVAPDGSIVAGGSLSLDGNPYFTLVRLTAAGQPDARFGDGGVLVLELVGDLLQGVTAVAVRPDGRIVAGGRYNSGYETQVDLFVAQFTPGGELDESFGDGGIVIEDRSGAGGARFEYVEDLALDALGRVVVAGATVTQSNPGIAAYDALLTRLLPDGRLDPSFGGGELVLTDIAGGRGDEVKSLALAGDDIVVAGTTWGSTGNSILVARFDAAGALDRAYGSAAGRTFSPSASGADVIVDGRGRAITVANGNTAIVVLRLTADGRPDAAFGPDGVHFRRLAGRVDHRMSLAMSRAGDEAVVVGTTGPQPTRAQPSQYPADVFVSRLGFTTGSGYWMLNDHGGVYTFGNAEYHGGVTTGGSRAVVDIEPRPDAAGYWIVDEGGAVYGLDATPYGGSPPLQPGERVTSLSATPSGRGYWLFTNTGRATPFGDAPFLGDMAGVALNGPVLDSVATPSGVGYYMVASDGGIFTFGDAVFHGSMGGVPLNQPVESLVPSATNRGYWLVASDGGVFSFGDAPFLGSMGDTRLNGAVTGMVRYGNGYLMVGADGGIFNFSDRPFDGSLGSDPPPHPIIAVAPVP